MVKIIPVSGDHIAYIDDEDYLLVFGCLWHYHSKPERRTGYAYRNSGGGYAAGLMHRLILGVTAGERIDHIDGNGLNNTKANLRVCSHTENTQNSHKRRSYDGKHTTSQYKGVNYKADRPRPRPWAARIVCNGTTYNIGHFTSEEEAAIAYDLKARELHGEFARLNFPNA